MIFRILFTLIIIFLLNIIILSASIAETCRYTFGVAPTFHPETTFEIWSPILKELGKRMNCEFILKPYATFGDLKNHLLTGQLDFALTGPYQVIVARRAQRYIPVLRDRDPIKGILVVRKDSRFSTVYSLNGTVIGFTDPNSFITTILMQKILRENFKITFKPKYLRTHDNVYRHVVLGFVDAGCGIDQTLNKQPVEIREKLHIIYESQPFPSPAIIVHPKVPKEIRGAFIKNFLAISREERFSRILSKTQIPNPIEADFNRDYRFLEKLALEKQMGLR